MATSPAFAATPRVSNVSILSTANVNRDGSGAVATAFAAGGSGSMVTRMTIAHVHATADPTPGGMIRIFHSPDSGTTYYLIKEVPVDSIDPEVGGEAVEGFRSQVVFDPPFFMPTGHQLGVTSHFGGGDDDFHITTEGGNL